MVSKHTVHRTEKIRATGPTDIHDIRALTATGAIDLPARPSSARRPGTTPPTGIAAS